MNRSQLNHNIRVPGDEAVSLALNELLQRLDLLERRVERLEATAATGCAAVAASNADAFVAASATGQARSVAAAAPAGQRAETLSHSGSSADAPVTERLDRVSDSKAAADPFPDLSLLDEKVEPAKGPAERLQVRAALEDYARISTRIQQLWGTPDCERYLNSLVIDTRGDRQGFPPAVMEELLYLGRLARALVILAVDGDLWDTFDQVGDRR